jgi:hypothetical protein
MANLQEEFLTGQKELKTALICEHLDKETQHGTVMIQ